MAQNPANIVQGPALMYVAPFGTAEPADSTANVNAGAPGGAWVDCGFTESDVVIEEDATYTDLTVSQVAMAVGTRLAKYTVQIKTQLAELTVTNLQNALNGLNTVTVSGAYTSIDRIQTTSATQPAYSAIIVDGWGPYLPSGQPARWRHIVRKCVFASKIMRTYSLTKKGVYDVTINGFWVSAATPPVHEVLQTS